MAVLSHMSVVAFTFFSLFAFAQDKPKLHLCMGQQGSWHARIGEAFREAIKPHFDVVGYYTEGPIASLLFLLDKKRKDGEFCDVGVIRADSYLYLKKHVDGANTFNYGLSLVPLASSASIPEVGYEHAQVVCNSAVKAHDLKSLQRLAQSQAIFMAMSGTRDGHSRGGSMSSEQLSALFGVLRAEDVSFQNFQPVFLTADPVLSPQEQLMQWVAQTPAGCFINAEAASRASYIQELLNKKTEWASQFKMFEVSSSAVQSQKVFNVSAVSATRGGPFHLKVMIVATDPYLHDQLDLQPELRDVLNRAAEQVKKQHGIH